MLEEPDVKNPGHTHTCVLPSVFVYYMYVYTMPEKLSILVYCVLYVCMYVHFQCASFVVEHTHGFML